MKSNEKIVAQFRKDWNISKRGLTDQWANSTTCHEFYAGDTMSYRDRIMAASIRGVKQSVKEQLVEFSKVMPYVDAVSGFMAQNRREANYVARIPNPDQNPVRTMQKETYSRFMNGTKAYVRENANADHVENEQTTEMLIQGYSAVDTDISYIRGRSTTAPNGEILIERVEHPFWDPRCQHRNLKGSRFRGYWKDYDLDDALALFQTTNEDDFQDASRDQDDREYYYNPYGGKYDKISFDESVEWSDVKERRVRVYNYQWFEYEPFYQADNPLYTVQDADYVQLAALKMQQLADKARLEHEYPDMFEFDPIAERLTFDASIKTELVKMFGDLIDPKQFTRKTFYTAVISGKKVFTAFRSISQQDFSIQLKTGSYSKAKKMFMGMVNGMMNPALYSNKALTELLFTIANNSRGGVLYEKGAIESVKEFEAKYNKTDAAVEVQEGALTAGKIQPKATTVPTTGLDGIIALSDNAIATASGVDPSFLGSREFAQEAGILYKRRIKQVLSTLAKYADSETEYQKMQSRILLDFMGVFAQDNEGMEFEITGEDGSLETITLMGDKFLAEYAVTIREAPQTPEDRQELSELLSTIADKISVTNPQAAQIIYARAIRNLDTIDQSDKQAIMQALQPQEQEDPRIAQLEQELQVYKDQATQAQVALASTQAELNRAKVAEVQANIENKAANTAKTIEDAQKTGIETGIIQANAARANITI